MGERAVQMSDIKYIIEGQDDDDGEHTRFPCLTMVSYAVAAAVTMLTVVVIVLVIHAVLRPDDVSLSVSNGYIGADSLWEQTVQVQEINMTRTPPISIGKVEPAEIGETSNKASAVRAPVTVTETDMYGSAATINVGVGSSSSALPKECYLGCHHSPAAQVTLHKAKATHLRVILIANNPSGRTKIECNDTIVAVIDMESPYGVIGTLKLGNFTVLPQTAITLQKRLKNANSSYIWENYGGDGRFSVKVQVNASVTSYIYPLWKKSGTKERSYVCKAVTVGLMEDEAIYATGHIGCS